MLLCCARSPREYQSHGPPTPRCNVRRLSCRRGGAQRVTPTALISLKHYKVLNEQDNLTESVFPAPDPAHYGTDKPELHLRSGIRYNFHASPCLSSGDKGSSCEKEMEAFYEKES
jgi:hypothetical protein